MFIFADPNVQRSHDCARVCHDGDFLLKLDKMYRSWSLHFKSCNFPGAVTFFWPRDLSYIGGCSPRCWCFRRSWLLFPHCLPHRSIVLAAPAMLFHPTWLSRFYVLLSNWPYASSVLKPALIVCHHAWNEIKFSKECADSNRSSLSFASIGNSDISDYRYFYCILGTKQIQARPSIPRLRPSVIENIKQSGASACPFIWMAIAFLPPNIPYDSPQILGTAFTSKPVDQLRQNTILATLISPNEALVFVPVVILSMTTII